MAASQDDCETIMRLKNQGVDLNSGDYDMRTPMHLASASGSLEVLEFLV